VSLARQVAVFARMIKPACPFVELRASDFTSFAAKVGQRSKALTGRAAAAEWRFAAAPVPFPVVANAGNAGDKPYIKFESVHSSNTSAAAWTHASLD